MDLVAGLHWLRENLPAFNGNPNMMTLMGHGHGAALANILIVSPVASGMYRNAISRQPRCCCRSHGICCEWSMNRKKYEILPLLYAATCAEWRQKLPCQDIKM
jgi:carboxylesterase type B